MVTRAQGVWLETHDGRRLIDGNGSWWTNTLGHSHPRLVAALIDQARTLAHCALSSIAHENAALLAKELTETAPAGLTRVHFSDDGSTALEVAIKIAAQYWAQNGHPQRTRFLSLGGGFHGDTIGAMSVSGLEIFKGRYGALLFDCVTLRGDNDAVDERTMLALESALASNDVAAVVIEPLIQGAAGMRIWSTRFLSRIRELVSAAGTLLIADEVFTGLGRTGAMWACDLAGVAPDLLCTAKALGGGMLPFAATLATERIYDGFRGGGSRAERALMHGHTFCGNPLGARVAREVLAVYRDERVLERVAAHSIRIRDAFDALSRVKGVRAVRSLGMVGAADLGDRTDYESELGWEIYRAALRRGACLRPLGNTVYVAPPFLISDEELDRLLRILSDSISEVM